MAKVARTLVSVVAAAAVSLAAVSTTQIATAQTGVEGAIAATVDGAAYQVEVRTQDRYAKGQPSAFEIVVRAKSGYRINKKFPVRFNFEQTTGVMYAEAPGPRTLERCASGTHDCTMRISVPFTPRAAGSHKVGGKLFVSVCNASQCLIEKPMVFGQIVVR